MFNIFDHQPYFNRNKAQRIRYVQSWMNNTFNVIAPILSTVVHYYSCSNENGWPWPSEKGGSFSSISSTERWGWVRDDVCMIEFNKGAIIVLMFANGFLCFDYIVCRYWILDRNSLNKQMEAHHIMAVLGYTSSFIGGFGMPMSGQASMITEVSGIFLNYKDMFSKENRNSPLGQFVQFMFFITYTFFRLIPLYFQATRIYVILALTIHKVGTFRALCQIFCLVNAILIVALNTYWYGLILKGIKRLLEEAGVLPKSKTDYSALD